MLHLGSRRAALRAKPVALAVASVFLPWNSAQAIPSNWETTVGTVDHTQTSSQTMRIDVTSKHAATNYRGGFSIGAPEAVNIRQLGRDSVFLVRDISGNPTSIFGTLTANGQLFLSNSNGVLFGRGAQVDVGSILATSLSMTDDQFRLGTQSGRYVWSRDGAAGSIINEGRINIIEPNGYAALVGPQVSNDGVIIANAGKVALAAGNAVSLTIGEGLISVVVDEAAFNASIVNTGEIQADGGTVLLKASRMNALLDTVINTSGFIRANRLAERDGQIVLDGGADGGVLNTGLVDAGLRGNITVTGGRFETARVVPDPMFLNGVVTAGTININVAADVKVDGAQITSHTGQEITAGSVHLRADGGFATIRNESGEQKLTTSAPGGIHVEALNGGSAILGKPFFFSGPPATDSQTITTARLHVQGGLVQANKQDITAASVLIERGSISSFGDQDLEVNGDLSLLSGSVSTISGKQTIIVTDGNVDVRATAAGVAASISAGGPQSISVIGGSIDVRASAPVAGPQPGASISTPGTQSISVTNGDHITVAGEVSRASISAGSGTQELSITGTTGGNALNIGSMNAGGTSQIVGPSQEITAGTGAQLGSVNITGSRVTNARTGIMTVTSTATPGNTQSVMTSGSITITGGNAENATPPTNAPASNAGIFHNSSGKQTVTASNVTLQGGKSGNGNGANIDSLGANIPGNSGEQELNVSGTIQLTGGEVGHNNRAVIRTGANQTITGKPNIEGNPNIILTGGKSGGAFGSNDVTIQSTGAGTTQTINAGNITVQSGGGMDASATITAARNVITTTGDMSVLGGAGPGGFNGARIGGLGGTTPGPTHLNLTVGGNLKLHGGMTNGASLGPSGASTQANVITVNALSTAEGKGNIELTSDGAAARIGSANPPPGQAIAPGSISVSAAETVTVGAGTAIRAADLTPPVANPPVNIALTANTLVNDGAISNGGGANTGNVVLIANAFDLDGGNIQGGNAAVILRPRDGSRSFGIEAAGDTTLRNADLAKINTSNFVVLGSGMGTNFTGSMTIGESAQVDGGTKSLAFFRSGLAAAADITIGSRGVKTNGGDVIISAGSGTIRSGVGVVAGDDVQLRATQGIGAFDARVNTAANFLAINNASGAGAFVSETDAVTLRNVNLTVGGNTNNFANVVGGSGVYDIAATSAITIADPVQASTVLLSAGAGITEVGTGAILANSLTTTSAGATSLTGANQVQSFKGSTSFGGNGGITLNNGTALNVTGLNAAGDATVNNAGPMTVSGFWTSTGATSITTKGEYSDLTIARSVSSGPMDVNAQVFSNGPMNVNVDGTLTVTASGVQDQGGPFPFPIPQFAALTSSGGQDIVAKSIRVSATNGGQASINNFSAGHQHISATGGGIAITSAPVAPGNFGGSAQIVNSGTGDQTITVSGGLQLSGAGGGAQINNGVPAIPTFPPSTGRQTITVTNGGIGLEAQDGGSASISNLGTADQVITTSAGGISIDASGDSVSLRPASFAQIANFGSGVQTVTASGALTVAAEGVQPAQPAPPPAPGFPPAPPPMPMPQIASLLSFGGQDVTAQSIAVSAQDGALASISNQAPSNQAPGNQPAISNQTAGNQTITVLGGGIEIRSSGGAVALGPGSSSAQISNSSFGNQDPLVFGQSVKVTNGDHIKVNGLGGSAGISASGGSQSVSITGTGANAIEIGSVGALGSSTIFGGSQTITAGGSGEQGRIAIVGSNGPAAFVGMSTSNAPIALNTQTVSTTGTITVRGGNSASQILIGMPGMPPVLSSSVAGIFHNSNGQQTVDAGGVVLQGGSGINNPAIIGSNQGGLQQVTAGAITLQGGSSGTNSGAFISSNTGGNQTLTAAGGTISITGGDGGTANRAGIGTNASQTINGNPDIFLTGGAAGGAANNVFIQATGADTTVQTINAGNIEIRAGGGEDASATINAAHNVITTTSDVSLYGSAGPGALNGVRIGGLGPTLGPTNLDLSVGGNLLLRGGTTNGASLGSSGASTQANVITVKVLSTEEGKGNITLESFGARARIGTNNPAASLPDGVKEEIEISAGGSLNIGERAGIRARGPITLTADSIQESALGAIVAASLTTVSTLDTTLNGANEIKAFNATSGGDVSLNNTGGLNVTGLIAAGDAGISNIGDVTVSGTWRSNGTSTIVVDSDINQAVASSLALFGGSAPGSAVQIESQGVITISVDGDLRLAGGSGDGAFARILGYSDINLTVGGLRLDRGSGQDAWARIQLTSRDNEIRLHFPNLAGGGFFVNGIESLLRDGKTGFLADNGVAAPDQQLILTYEGQ